MATKQEVLHVMRSTVPNVGDAVHTSVLNALHERGYVRFDDDPIRASSDIFGTLRAQVQHGAVMTPRMAASAHQNNPVLIRQVRAACARYGYNLKDDEKVDLVKLNAALKASNATIEQRFQVKEMLSVLHLLER